MYRTLKAPFRASSTTIQKLFDIRRLCGYHLERLCTNWLVIIIVWVASGSQKHELQKELKRLYPIHSQTIQAVAHKFLAAREGTKRGTDKKDIKQVEISVET